MKRVIAILMMFLFIGILPVMAQSEGTLSVEPVATTEAAATVEATAPAETGGNVVINVDADNDTENTTTPPPAGDSTIVIVLALMNVGQMGIILAQAIMNNGSVSKKTIDTFFGGLKGLTRLTAWDGDEKIVEAGEKVTVALLGDRIKTEVSGTTPVAGQPG